ncbi:rab9 effector protein with kelch motifs-like isoform X1 [Clavelina lepadiformis]|uniref:rab9 effector protein with kelch motifs-like isoform X1 n=1 Tax=Clavelina lepadiformis TaxID=159417 RepID=UPI0040415266
MELHPILESGQEPKSNLWYVISSLNAPSPRVGQSCVFIHKTHSINIIGGADPSTTHDDIFRLDLLTQTWAKVDSDSFEERYEHCAYVPQSSPTHVFVFGGANKQSNLNSIQLIITDSGKVECSTVNCSGNAPCPRTIHSAASSGDFLYVWGGGEQGANPVMDQQLHVFNSNDNSWKQLIVSGKLPSPRHGHVMAVVGKILYVHGGMSGATFHKDMHAINLTELKCAKVKFRGDIPSSRAAHAACTYKNFIYLFGGMSADGALDDMYQFNTRSSNWIKLKTDCPPPTPRLDHSMILAYLPHKKELKDFDSDGKTSAGIDEIIPVEDSEAPTLSDGDQKPSIVPLDEWGSGEGAGVVTAVEGQLSTLALSERNLPTTSDGSVDGDVPVCVVFGGMDASGNIFNDLLVLKIDET